MHKLSSDIKLSRQIGENYAKLKADEIDLIEEE